MRDLGTTGDTGPMPLASGGAPKGPKRATIGARPGPRIDFKALFGLEAGRWAWTTAVSAAVAMTVSFTLATLLFGPQIGTLAALGSMTVLYEKKTPYSYRAAALALVGLGFVAAVAVNSLASALSPWAAVVSIGATAGLATWVCAAWRVDKPGPMFFVLVATISTIAPGGVAEVPLHALVAALGAAVGWTVSMSGVATRARHPEYEAVAEAFRTLATLLRSVGTSELDHAQHEASVAVAEAWRIVLLGQTRGYRPTPEAARLRALLRWVSDSHRAATQVCIARTTALPEQAAEFADHMAPAVADPSRAPDPEALHELRRGMRPRSLEARLYSLLARTAQAAHRSPRDEDVTEDERSANLHDDRYPALLSALRSSLSKDSLIRPTALRMGLTVTAAGLFGLWIGLDHYYWVALTTTSVLQAGNVVLTFNRSVQRSLGTLLGVLAGVGLLVLGPPLAAVIVLAGLLQGATQLVVARNFFYASIMLTPMALMLSYTAQPHPLADLAGSRIIDTVVGSAFGLAGALLLWRKASATRLPQAIANVLERTRECMMEVLDQDSTTTEERRYRLRRDMRAATVSLRGVYESALGDAPRAASTRPLWPVVVATQRIGYLGLAALSQDSASEPVGTITLQRVDLAFQELIAAIGERRTPRLGALPRLPSHPRINMELRALANAMTSAVALDERAAQQEADRRARREQRRARHDVDADL